MTQIGSLAPHHILTTPKDATDRLLTEYSQLFITGCIMSREEIDYSPFFIISFKFQRLMAATRLEANHSPYYLFVPARTLFEN